MRSSSRRPMTGCWKARSRRRGRAAFPSSASSTAWRGTSPASSAPMTWRWAARRSARMAEALHGAGQYRADRRPGQRADQPRSRPRLSRGAGRSSRPAPVRQRAGALPARAGTCGDGRPARAPSSDRWRGLHQRPDGARRDRRAGRPPGGTRWSPASTAPSRRRRRSLRASCSPALTMTASAWARPAAMAALRHLRGDPCRARSCCRAVIHRGNHQPWLVPIEDRPTAPLGRHPASGTNKKYGSDTHGFHPPRPWRRPWSRPCHTGLRTGTRLAEPAGAADQPLRARRAAGCAGTVFRRLPDAAARPAGRL